MGSSFVRAVVTGGAGFLGSHVCEQLLRRGTDVVCVDNFLTGSPGNLSTVREDSRFTLMQADASTGLAVEGPVDLVMHLACPASPADYLRHPIETMRSGGLSTMHALDLAHRKGARFVLASTSEVYGDPLEHPQRESYWGNVNPIGPRSVYDESKRFSEALTAAYRREHGLRTGIARIFNSYGPRLRPEDGRMIPTFIRQALDGDELTVTGHGRQTRSICYVDDTVTGLLALAHSECEGPVNIGNPHEFTVLEIAQRIQRLTGSRSPIRHVDAMVDDPQRRCPDISLAKRLLGWQPVVEVDDGLQRTASWFARMRADAV
jgi:dTDP-glucose 4,6-dehydratase